MPSADQIKALLLSHAQGDDAQFYAIAMQIAAGEARGGHGKVAQEIRALIDKAKSRPAAISAAPIPLTRPRGELADLLGVRYPDTRLSDLILSKSLAARLARVVREHKSIGQIRQHGLSPRRKLLLAGSPGTGKTLSAAALAGELGLPLFTVRLDSLFTKFMGETAAKLRLIFDALHQTRAVYLFDEFDSIGSHRTQANDVGEMRRVVNSFLQMVEQDSSDSLIIAATNHIGLLDRALFRRFDDIIEFELPDQEHIKLLLKTRLAGFLPKQIRWSELTKLSAGLSYGDLTMAAENAMKTALIEGRKAITNADLSQAIRERRASMHEQGVELNAT